MSNKLSVSEVNCRLKMSEPQVHLKVGYVAFFTRVFHMLSISILVGQTITNALMPSQELTRQSAFLFATAGVISIATGIINLFVLKPKEIMRKKDASKWIGMLHFKLLLTVVLYTPLLPKVFNIRIPGEVKAGVIVLMVIFAAYMRYFREAAAALFSSLKSE